MIIAVIGFIVILICEFIQIIVDIINSIPGVSISAFGGDCPSFEDLTELIDQILSMKEFFKNIKIPNLSYPDCDVCSCGDPNKVEVELNEQQQQANTTIQNSGGYGVVTNFFLDSSYPITGVTIFNTQNNFNIHKIRC